MAHKIMRAFRIDEISGVDRPAQKGARAVIMKRDTSEERPVTKKAIGGSLAIAVGRDAPTALPEFFALAKDIDAALAKYNQNHATDGPGGGRFAAGDGGELSGALGGADRSDEAKHIGSKLQQAGWKEQRHDGYSTFTHPTRQGEYSIADRTGRWTFTGNGEASGSNRASFETHRDHQLSKSDDLETVTAALAGAIVETLKSEESERAPLLQKIFAEFRSRNQLLLAGDMGAVMNKELAKALGLAETATDAEVTAAVAKVAKDTKDATDKVAKLEADLKVAKLSPEQRAFYDKACATDKEKADFADMTDEEKAAKMKAQKVEKSADQVRIEKMEAENADLKKRFEKAEDDTARGAAIAKADKSLTYIGKGEEVGGLVHDITKLDEKLGKAVEAQFTALNARLEKSSMFDEIGRANVGDGSSAAATIQKRAQEKVEKSDGKVTIEAARDQVRREDPELEKREDQERSGRRKAA